MWADPQFSAGLLKFAKEILDGKLLFLCSAMSLGDRIIHLARKKC